MCVCCLVFRMLRIACAGLLTHRTWVCMLSLTAASTWVSKQKTQVNVRAHAQSPSPVSIVRLLGMYVVFVFSFFGVHACGFNTCAAMFLFMYCFYPLCSLSDFSVREALTMLGSPPKGTNRGNIFS